MSTEGTATTTTTTAKALPWQRSVLREIERGASVHVAAIRAGTSNSSLYRYFDEHPDFAAQVAEARSRAKICVSNEDHGNWVERKGLAALGLSADPDTLKRYRVRGTLRFKTERRRGALYYLYWKPHVEKLVAESGQTAELRAEHRRRLDDVRRRGVTSTQPHTEKGVRWCPTPWLATQEAIAAEIGFQSFELLTWSNEKNGSCPWLNGERLSARTIVAIGADSLPRKVKFYRESDLRRIKRAQAKMPNADLAGLAEAKREYRQPQSVIERGRRAVLPRLGRRLVARTAYLPTQSRNGRTILRRRTGYARRDLQTLKDRPHVVPPDPARYVSRAEMAREANVSVTEVSRWIREGHPGPNGSRLEMGGSTPFNVETGGPCGGRVVKVAYYSRVRFDAVMAFRTCRETWATTYTDRDGTWYRHGYVKAVLGTIYLLPCPALGGRPIRRKRIPRPVGAGGGPRLSWGYLVDDVNTAEAALRGARWADPARTTHTSASPVDLTAATATTARSALRRKPGRPVDTDADADRRIAEAWATGLYANKAALAREKGCTEKAVKDALERHRKRAQPSLGKNASE